MSTFQQAPVPGGLLQHIVGVRLVFNGSLFAVVAGVRADGLRGEDGLWLEERFDFRPGRSFGEFNAALNETLIVRDIARLAIVTCGRRTGDRRCEWAGVEAG